MLFADRRRSDHFIEWDEGKALSSRLSVERQNTDPGRVHTEDGRRNPMRPLTHDERKAVEAAFGDRPFNSHWSAAAKVLYNAIIQATSAYRADCEREPVGRC